MSSSRFLTGCCEKNLIEGENGRKWGSLPEPQGKRPIIGRTLAKYTVRRYASYFVPPAEIMIMHLMNLNAIRAYSFFILRGH